MTKSFKKIAFASLLLFCVACASAQDKKDQLKVALSRPGKPFRLTTSLLKGSISVTGYAGSELLIETELLPEKPDKSELNKNQNANANVNVNRNEHTSLTETKFVKGKHVTATETNNSVSIGPNNLSSNIRVIVKIPQTSARLNLSIGTEGSISVTDVNAEIEITNPNGSVSLSNITGSALVTSVTGNITAGFKSVNEKSPMAFTTLTGKVDVSFPSTLKADIRMQSDDGKLYSDYEVSFTGTKPAVVKVNTPCVYQLKSTEAATGSVNGGGQKIFLKTMQGNVYLHKTK